MPKTGDEFESEGEEEEMKASERAKSEKQPTAMNTSMSAASTGETGSLQTTQLKVGDEFEEDEDESANLAEQFQGKVRIAKKDETCISPSPESTKVSSVDARMTEQNAKGTVSR